LNCAAVAWNLKHLTPAPEYDLFKFATAGDLIQWEVYSAVEDGGVFLVLSHFRSLYPVVWK
jgi:porphobilinogen deaminase